MALTSGTKLGPYQVIAPIGAGGMGEVYRARDAALERDVAVKVLPTVVSEDPDRLRRFKQEAQATAALNHPNILAIFHVGEQNGTPYIVSELLEGESLRQRLQAGPLPVRKAIDYAVQVARGLAAAHNRGIIHRDLKPENIFLTRDGRAKILDFGLAKLSRPEEGASNSDSPTLTRHSEPDVVLGTVGYMSPEQLRGQSAGPASDLFSFGAILYEMLAGKGAFCGTSAADIMSAILKEDPAHLVEVNRQIPPAVERIVRHCLEKNPEERFQSAQDVKIQLEWIEERAPAKQRTGRWGRWPALLVIAALAIALAASIFWGFHRGLQAVESVRLRSSLLPPLGTSYQPYGFALSPDGTRLAFVGVDKDGQTALYVRSLASTATQAFPGTSEASYPFWAPDSRSIAFFAERQLKALDLASGNVQNVTEAPLGLGGTWNQDDVILFATIAGPLLRVSAAGGRATPVTAITVGGHRWPWFLPDGRHFIFCEDRSTANNPRGNGIFLASLDSARARLISQDLPCDTQYAAGHLLYLHDRNLMTQPFDAERGVITGTAVPVTGQEIETDPAFGRAGFTSAATGELVFQSAADLASRLVWFDASGKAVGRISETGLKDPRLSPDGQRVAVSSDDAHNGSRFIRVYDLKRGVSTRLTDSGQEEFPLWSPDGKSVMYLGRPRGGDACIYRVAADASAPPVTVLKGPILANDWHDGWIVYMNFEKGFPSLWANNLDTRERRQLGEGSEAQFSPDGKWIAFATGISGQGGQVYVETFPGPGPRIQISNQGGGQPQWSRNGHQLFYIQADRKLMVVDLELRNDQINASAPRLVFQTRITAPHIALFQYAVAGDGRFLVNSLPTESPSALTLLTNAISTK